MDKMGWASIAKIFLLEKNFAFQIFHNSRKLTSLQTLRFPFHLYTLILSNRKSMTSHSWAILIFLVSRKLQYRRERDRRRIIRERFFSGNKQLGEHDTIFGVKC